MQNIWLTQEPFCELIINPKRLGESLLQLSKLLAVQKVTMSIYNKETSPIKFSIDQPDYAIGWENIDMLFMPTEKTYSPYTSKQEQLLMLSGNLPTKNRTFLTLKENKEINNEI